MDTKIEHLSNITNGAGGGDGGSGSMALEPSCPMANYGVPPFLTKLFKIVNDKTTDPIISWDPSSTSVVIFDEQRFRSEILPSYFKTSRLDSFTSQLNNYGFKKNGWNRLEFAHEYFRQGKQHLLKNITRRSKQSKLINNANEINDTFVKIRRFQKEFKNKTQRFKDSTEKTISEVQSISETMTHKLVSTFFDRKRKFIDMDTSIDFVDIENDLESVYGQLTVSDGNDVDIFRTLNELTMKGLGCARGDSRSTPPFLQKLYDMVEKKDINHLISWKLPACDSFVIWDVNKFATDVLPIYFSHKNFSSFHSQLNIYRFKKICWERHEYANEWFRGGRMDLLTNIKRRDKNIQARSCAMTFSSKELERIKNTQREQENNIIRLLNYEEQTKNSVHEFKETVVNLDNIIDKMILQKYEKDENLKKTKLDIEENVIDNEKGRDLEVDEPGENHIVSIDNNNVEPQSYFQDLGFDLEEMKRIMEMEDTWIIDREMDYYLSWCHGNSNEIDENIGLDDT